MTRDFISSDFSLLCCWSASTSALSLLSSLNLLISSSWACNLLVKSSTVFCKAWLLSLACFILETLSLTSFWLFSSFPSNSFMSIWSSLTVMAAFSCWFLNSLHFSQPLLLWSLLPFDCNVWSCDSNCSLLSLRLNTSSSSSSSCWASLWSLFTVFSSSFICESFPSNSFSDSASLFCNSFLIFITWAIASSCWLSSSSKLVSSPSFSSCRLTTSDFCSSNSLERAPSLLSDSVNELFCLFTFLL